MADAQAALLAEGEAALGVGNWQLAAERFRAAVETEPTPEAHFGLASAVWWLGDMHATVAHLERAYAGFHERQDVPYAAASALRLGFHYGLHLANLPAASGWLARSERLIDAHGLEPLRGELWLTKSCLSADAKQASAWARTALELGRAAGDPDLELCALGQLGASLVQEGQVSEGIQLLDEAMAGCAGGEPRNIDTVAFTSCITMVACGRCADFDRARQWLRALERFTERHGSPFHHAECRVAHGELLFHTGDWVSAETVLEAAIELSRDTLPSHHEQALATLAALRLAQGREEEAERLVLGVDTSPRAVEVRASVALRRGKPELARRIVERRLDVIGSQGLEAGGLVELLGRALIAEGRASDAAAHAEALAALAVQLGCRLLEARGARLLGEALLAAGDRDAQRHIDRAHIDFLELGLVYEAARTRLAMAAALPEPELAASEAESALDVFERLGARTDADACAALLRQLGQRSRRSSEGGGRALDTLTRREREVLSLLGQGLSNPEIAQRLFISRKTVENHVAHILEKLHLRRRTEAVAEALRRGIR